MIVRFRQDLRAHSRDMILYILTAIPTVLFSLYIALRSRPMLNTDYDAFLFVGSRLAQGDRAYIDAWDNKDPVTYWLAAFVNPETPIVSHLIELLWLALIGASAYVVARAFQSPAIVAFLAGVSLGPLAVLTLSYFPGATEVPGVALTLAALALALRGRDALSGVVLALLVFAKIIFVPVAAVMVTVGVLRLGQQSDLKKIFAGFIAACTVLVGALLVRGELLGYVETLMMNVQYSNAGLNTGSAMSTSESISERLSLVLGYGLLGSIVLFILLFALASAILAKGWTIATPELRNAWTVTVSSALTALAVVALTAKSPHHLLLLAVPMILAALFIISIAQNNTFVAEHFSKFARKVTGSLVTVALAVIATGIISPLDHKFLAEYGLDRSDTNFSRGPIVTWLKENRQYQDVPIQFIGQWESVPITGSDLKWVMGCRFIGQGSLATELILDESLECLNDSPIVFVRPPALPTDEENNYSAFWRQAMQKLTSEFDCSVEKGFNVCFKRTLSLL